MSKSTVLIRRTEHVAATLCVAPCDGIADKHRSPFAAAGSQSAVAPNLVLVLVVTPPTEAAPSRSADSPPLRRDYGCEPHGRNGSSAATMHATSHSRGQLFRTEPYRQCAHLDGALRGPRHRSGLDGGLRDASLRRAD